MDLSSAQFTSIFNFATEQGRTLVDLLYLNLWICLGFLVTVAGLLIFGIIKYRHRPGDGEPDQTEGSTTLEIIWTAIPLVIFLYLGWLTFSVMGIVYPPAGKRQPDITVIGHQFWWEYRYPKSGVVTANELYLPLGSDLMLEIRGADVIHSFWVPGFGQKMDAIPGHPNNLFLKPIREGLFLGQCAEYCGSQHSLMRIMANVVSPKEFEAWTKSQAKVPAPPTDKTALHGRELFMSRTCIQCHSIAGTCATAQVAPDLTHIADRKTIGAGVIANNLENLTEWIMDPQQFKPGSLMPNMRLTKSEAHDIAFYLENLK
ncbi:MAG: cytochrome c oxidase subunit II [Candidatus Melainabacteria bacterium]|nr:MAG: cytochrome c oxidase subunit II [Candidatus Melainabacteria bacterium]